MFKKSKLMLPVLVAVFIISILFPSGVFAQLAAGSVEDCIDNFITEYGFYVSDVEVNFDESGCGRFNGMAHAFREGDDGTNLVRFRAVAAHKQCWAEDQAYNLLGISFQLSGKDVSMWKKFLLDEGCDLVNYDEKIVFLTQMEFKGDLVTGAKNLGIKGKIKSGLDAADKICTKLANDAELPGDTYTAWLSDSTTDARDRVTQSALPYVLVNGELIADDFTDLITCDPNCLIHEINRDQLNSVRTGGAIWTATEKGGAYNSTSGTCENWTATTGSAPVGSVRTPAADGLTEIWTDWEVSALCSTQRRFYCFQN